MIDHDVIATDMIETPAGIFRVEYRPDYDADSPRGDSTLGVLIIDEDYLDINEIMRRERYMGTMVYVCTDHSLASAIMVAIDGVRQERVSVHAACRYLRLVTGAWAALPVYASDLRYSVRVETGDDESDDRGAISGFILDTETTRREMGPHTPAQAVQWLREEIAELSRWTEGEYVMYSIERLTDPLGEADVADANAAPEDSWTVVDSLCGLGALTWAQEEARATVAAYRAAGFPSPVLAAQV